jgi:shikimate dehydrogenase
VITGSTRVAAVIGSPVEHSLSPALHNAAFGHLGIDWVYVAFHVPAGGAPQALDAMRALGVGGLSVTMPHKEAVAEALAVDGRLDPAAAALRSVNTVVAHDDGLLVGHSTDGAGFVSSLRSSGVEVRGRSVCLLGGGGAARAIADALGRAGVGHLAVRNRTRSAAESVAELAAAAGALAASVDPADDRAVAEAEIIVNATSIGMGVSISDTDDTASLPRHVFPCDPALINSAHVVADIVYHPRVTPLLRAARATGAVAIDGLGMLVHQAALQQRLWHGRAPDLVVMEAAAERELAARRQ